MNANAMIALIGVVVGVFTSLLVLAFWLGRISMKVDEHDRRIGRLEDSLNDIFAELRKVARLIVEGPPTSPEG